MRSVRLAIVAASLIASGCVSGNGSSGSIRIQVVSGGVEIGREGTPFARVEGSVNAAAGDRIRTGDDGVVVLSYGSGKAELGPSSEALLRADRPFLRRGGLLADGAVVVEAEEADLRTRGRVRVDRGLALRVGAYEGRATMSRGRDRVEVGRFREGQAARGFFVRATLPLRVSETDTWDGRFLSEQFALERSLSGFNIGDLERDRLVRLILALGPRVPDSLLSGLDPTDTAIAGAIAAKSPGNFEQNAASAADLRRQGAQWAVVAATLHSGTDGVIDGLRRAADEAGVVPTSSPRASIRPPTPRPGATASPRPGPQPTPVPTSPPTPRPSPGPSPDPCPGCSPAERLICEATGVCPAGLLR